MARENDKKRNIKGRLYILCIDRLAVFAAIGQEAQDFAGHDLAYSITIPIQKLTE
jgi:hypothetical protein